MSYVYHGSPYRFKVGKPMPTTRGKFVNGKLIIGFQATTFHVTPHKWIALNYTGIHPYFYHKGKRLQYTTGVDLYKNNHIVEVHGKNSLKYSLDKIYGKTKTRYIYIFDKKRFTTAKGLGKSEMVSYTEEKPIKIIKIRDAVAEMQKEGVKFVFRDITKNLT
ncbi:MAG: hypothetical protein Faunusvirus10_10 [Faunusvirus sp.]|jgi:hypothetical protein|uniref:Uncharacterized protein n=1 Tax=Faunusvirus sp. TaxID=2487766 RepID=A0A3G4ZWR2_9VIRU|nr:MAG: hypothetical protein Faunusvirus10_10 [Faunusvirus sp.]